MPIQGVDYKVLQAAIEAWAHLPAPGISGWEIDELRGIVQDFADSYSMPAAPAISRFEQDFIRLYEAHYAMQNTRPPEAKGEAWLSTAAAIRERMLTLGAEIYANPGTQSNLFGAMSVAAAHDHFDLAASSARRAAGLADAHELALHLFVAELAALQSGTADQAALGGLRVDNTYMLNQQTYRKLWDEAVKAGEQGDLEAMSASFDKAHTFALNNGVEIIPQVLTAEKKREGYQRAVELALDRAAAHARTGDLDNIRRELGVIQAWRNRCLADPSNAQLERLRAIERTGHANAVPNDWLRAAELLAQIASADGDHTYDGFLQALRDVKDHSEAGGVPPNEIRIMAMKARGYVREFSRLMRRFQSLVEVTAGQIRVVEDVARLPTQPWSGKLDHLIERAQKLVTEAGQTELLPQIEGTRTKGRDDIIGAFIVLAKERADKGDIQGTRTAMDRALELAEQWGRPGTISGAEFQEIERQSYRNGAGVMARRAEDIAENKPRLTYEMARGDVWELEKLIAAEEECIEKGGVEETDDERSARLSRQEGFKRAVHRRAVEAALLSANIEAEGEYNSRLTVVDRMEELISSASRHAVVAGGVVIPPKRVSDIRQKGYSRAYEQAMRAAALVEKEESVVSAKLGEAIHFALKAGITFNETRAREIWSEMKKRIAEDLREKALRFARAGMPDAAFASLRDARDVMLNAGEVVDKKWLDEVRAEAKKNHGAWETPQDGQTTRVQHLFMLARTTLDPDAIRDFLREAREPHNDVFEFEQAFFGGGTDRPRDDTLDAIADQILQGDEDTQRRAATKRDLVRLVEAAHAEIILAGLEESARKRGTTRRALGK